MYSRSNIRGYSAILETSKSLNRTLFIVDVPILLLLIKCCIFIYAIMLFLTDIKNQFISVVSYLFVCM